MLVVKIFFEKTKKVRLRVENVCKRHQLLVGAVAVNIMQIDVALFVVFIASAHGPIKDKILSLNQIDHIFKIVT